MTEERTYPVALEHRLTARLQADREMERAANEFMQRPRRHRPTAEEKRAPGAIRNWRQT